MKETDAKFTREDAARLAGLALVVCGFLLLGKTPGLAYSAWHGSGYRRTEGEVLSLRTGHGTSFRLRVSSTGEELRLGRNRLHDAVAGSVVPVWYDPDARLELPLGPLAFVVFDERLLDARDDRKPPTRLAAFLALVGHAAVLGAGTRLMGWAGRTKPGSEAGRRRRKRGRSR